MILIVFPLECCECCNVPSHFDFPPFLLLLSHLNPTLLFSDIPVKPWAVHFQLPQNFVWILNFVSRQSSIPGMCLILYVRLKHITTSLLLADSNIWFWQFFNDAFSPRFLSFFPS